MKEVEVFCKLCIYTLEQMINATHGTLRAFAIDHDETTTDSMSGMSSSEFHFFH